MSTDTKDIIDADFETQRELPSNGGALIVAEVNAIRSMCLAKPRDESAIAEKVKATLKLYPGMAAKMRYCKPVGWRTIGKCVCGRVYECAGFKLFDKKYMKECPACGQKNVDMKGVKFEQQFARGLSVKAAEYLATELMYCRTDVGVEKLDNDTYKVTAKFFDVQSGRYNSREGIVSRFHKKGGSMERVDDDRFFQLIIPAAQSKLLREMVNRAVPFVIRHVLEETVDEVIEELLTPEQMEKIVSGFAKFDITADDLAKILGTKQEHWTHDDRRRCVEMYGGLKNNEVTKEELLAVATSSDAAPPAGTATNGNVTTPTPGVVTGADIAAAGKSKDATSAKQPRQSAIDPVATYKAALAGAVTEADCRNAYEYWGHPERCTWPETYNSQAVADMNARITSLKENRSGEKESKAEKQK